MPTPENATQDPRTIILATLGRARAAGESREMAARWIVEDLNNAGLRIVSASLLLDEMTAEAQKMNLL